MPRYQIITVNDTSTLVVADSMNIVNSAGWSVNLAVGSAMVGTMTTVNNGGYISVVNTAGWLVNIANTGGSQILSAGTAVIGTANAVLSPGSAIVGTAYTILLPSSASLNAGSATIGTAYAILLPSSASLNAGVASIGTASVILMNTANWYVNVVNTAGITLGAGAALIGSTRTLQYAAESMGLVGGSATFGTAYAILLPSSASLNAGVASIGTASVILMNTQNWVVRVQNTAGITLGGASATIGTAYAILLPSSASLNAGVAQIGTASVTLINTANWTVSNRQEVMSMASSNVTVFSYSTGIECSATNNLIIAASASRVFKILGYTLMSAVANNALFQSGSNLTELKTGTHFFGGSGGIVAPYNPMGWFSVTAGSPLYLKLATANSVGGVISYLVM